jgi:hypothetical protein
LIICFATVACLLAPASAGAWAARPPVSLVASPARVAIGGAGRQVVTVTSSGSEPVLVEVGKAGYALDLRGRPRVARARASWVTVRPRRLAIAPGRSASFVVVSSPPVHAGPGDHSELVLLTTRPARTAALAVRMRLGVIVVVRVAGRIVHRLDALRMRVRPRGLELLVANRGNVTETVARRCVGVTVRRAGRVAARLHPIERRLLPHTSGLVELPYRRSARGRVTVAVALAPGPPCATRRRRAFVLRL